jgi:hypothetical protein
MKTIYGIGKSHENRIKCDLYLEQDRVIIIPISGTYPYEISVSGTIVNKYCLSCGDILPHRARHCSTCGAVIPITRKTERL